MPDVQVLDTALTTAWRFDIVRSSGKLIVQLAWRPTVRHSLDGWMRNSDRFSASNTVLLLDVITLTTSHRAKKGSGHGRGGEHGR